MQTYGQEFAQLYNAKWSGFARQVAPLIYDFYAATPVGRTNNRVLDLCCGAGHLAVHFLDKGCKVVGIDQSEYMLHYARENAGRYLESGQARFYKADASDFAINERFGLAVSAYDSLNHLEDEQALISCFRCVHAVSEGYFIFDLNTKAGLKSWNSVRLDESDEETFIITRGSYDGKSEKAWIKITGFMRISNGLYKRIDETIYNTIFDMEMVKNALLQVGWGNVHFARIQNLSIPLAEPEEEARVFIVAGK